MNASVPVVHEPEVIAQQQPAALIPADMEQAIKLAQMMAKGKLVPQHLQESPADCLMVIEQAARWRMSPFAVAQCTSSIKGKLMFEGKLVAAAIHTSGIVSRRLTYEFEGEGAKRAVIVRGTIRGESDQREVRVALVDAKTDNGIWNKQPDQQLVYHGTRVWARRHAPEVMLGVYAPEEEFDEGPAQEKIVQPVALPQSKSKPVEQVEHKDEKPDAPPENPKNGNGEDPVAGVNIIAHLRRKLAAMSVTEADACKKFSLGKLEDIRVSQANECLAWLNK